MSSLQKFELFLDLPKEIRSLILLECDYDTILRCSLVSKDTREEVLNNDWFWGCKTEKDFGALFPITHQSTGWMTYTSFRRIMNDSLVEGACSGDLSWIQKYLRAGANPNFQDLDGNTPLLEASNSGHTAVVRELLKFKADPNIDGGGSTPLLEASISGHYLIVEALLEQGAKVNEKSFEGKTALMFASRDRNQSIVEILLKWNADPNTKDDGGMTAMMIAQKAEEIDIIELLEGYQK